MVRSSPRLTSDDTTRAYELKVQYPISRPQLLTDRLVDKIKIM